MLAHHHEPEVGLAVLKTAISDCDYQIIFSKLELLIPHGLRHGIKQDVPGATASLNRAMFPRRHLTIFKNET